MADEKIRLLLSLGRDEARLLLNNGEYALYRRIQRKMLGLVREYEEQLPLNCLQCFMTTVSPGKIYIDIKKPK